jgi:Protein kinase domain
MCRARSQSPIEIHLSKREGRIDTCRGHTSETVLHFNRPNAPSFFQLLGPSCAKSSWFAVSVHLHQMDKHTRAAEYHKQSSRAKHKHRKRSVRLEFHSLGHTTGTAQRSSLQLFVTASSEKDLDILQVRDTQRAPLATKRQLRSIGCSRRLAAMASCQQSWQCNQSNQLPRSQQCVHAQQQHRPMQSCSSARERTATTTCQQQHELAAATTHSCAASTTAAVAAAGSTSSSSSSSSSSGGGGAGASSSSYAGDDEGRGLQQFERKPSRGSSSNCRLQSSGGARADRIRPGRWAAGEHIGRGSFGSVCKAMNTDTGVEFAVKEVFISAVSAHGAGLEALTREIEVMRGLRHCNIVRYLGFEVRESTNYQYLPVCMPVVSYAVIVQDTTVF